MTPRIESFLADKALPTPFLVVDLDIVADNYRTLTAQMPDAAVYYAVKANPDPAVLRTLARLGSNFDVASRGEVELCLETGIAPDRISFGNTIKKTSDIAYAYQMGVRLYAFDSVEELEKLAEHAPGARVFCRLLVDCAGADWPLSRKFGCTPAMAEKLLLAARDLGLVPVGLSFHVGSQQRLTGQWDPAIGASADLFRRLADQGLQLTMVNLGGGMPAHYRESIEPVSAYACAINDSLTRHFGNDLPQVMIEPGRSLVGDAGMIESEIVLVSRKDEAEAARWVYLDIGKFNGLAEAMDDSIRYRLRAERNGAELDGDRGPVVLAGPTCDSTDILYEKAGYELPTDLKAGDKVRILSTGAYTTTYASVGFNGFPPLTVYCI